MSKERKRTGADNKAEQLNGRKIAYRFSDDPEGDFKVASISSSDSDEINLFVKKELQRINDSIVEIDRKITEAGSKKKHGQRVSKSEVTEIRKSLEDRKNKLGAKKMVLTGKANTPIVLVKENDEITGSSLSLTHKESHWWSFLKDRPNILKLRSEDFDVVIRAYFLRYDIRTGDKEAKKEYYELLSSLSNEDKTRLAPFLGEVTKYLAS